MKLNGLGEQDQIEVIKLLGDMVKGWWCLFVLMHEEGTDVMIIAVYGNRW